MTGDCAAPGGDGLGDTEPVSALEAEMAAMWRRSRTRVRSLAREVHPQLDPAVYPLVVLLVTRGPMRISDVGIALQLDKSTASRQVDAVVRLGLGERQSESSDARVRLVGLTPEGRARVERLQEEQVRRWRASLAEWPTEDVRLLTALLHRLGETGLA